MRWVWVVVGMLATPALACEVTEPLIPADFAGDAEVLAGIVTDFRTDGVTDLVTMTPDFALQGSLPRGSILVVMDQTMGTVLMVPKAGDRVIVGVTLGKARFERQLTAPLCGTAHLLPDTLDNRENIAFALAGD
jgi:hypothetical protein